MYLAVRRTTGWVWRGGKGVNVLGWERGYWMGVTREWKIEN